MESKNNQQKHGSSRPAPSKADLFSSAQVVADAAKSTLRHDADVKVDKGKAAGAAANILHAASHYGKLEEKSFGKYIQKAEDYLHQYESSHSASTPSTTGGKPTNPTAHSSTEHASSKPHSSSAQHEPTSDPHASDKKNKKQKEESESGMGDYIKLAQGFMGKHGGDHSGGGSGAGAGVGDYVKLAQGFLKKH